MVVSESVGKHTVSSGTDNDLGTLLEHRHLSLPMRFIHMVVHNLIKFNKNLLSSLYFDWVLGIPQ